MVKVCTSKLLDNLRSHYREGDRKNVRTRGCLLFSSILSVGKVLLIYFCLFIDWFVRFVCCFIWLYFYFCVYSKYYCLVECIGTTCHASILCPVRYYKIVFQQRNWCHSFFKHKFYQKVIFLCDPYSQWVKIVEKKFFFKYLHSCQSRYTMLQPKQGTYKSALSPHAVRFCLLLYLADSKKHPHTQPRFYGLLV